MAKITLEQIRHSYEANPRGEQDYALKEIDAVACATARDLDQVVKILHYVIEQV